MKQLFIVRAGAAVVALVIGAAIGTLAVRAQGPSFQGQWRSVDTTIRIVVNKLEANGTFVETGQGAQALGFKPEDTSFVATVIENYLYGEQMIRYGGTCHPTGRKVPMMGRLTPNGQALAIHFYNVQVDQNCRDTGEYSVTESLWQRVPGQ